MQISNGVQLVFSIHNALKIDAKMIFEQVRISCDSQCAQWRF